jgi:predicted dehydrogenase
MKDSSSAQTIARSLRVGISGLGSFAVVLSNAIEKSTKVNLVACYSRTPEKRAIFSQRYGCTQEESFEAMVRRDDLDAVVLATPNAVHREQAEIAAHHGKHVFIEKPIANTLEDGRKIINACMQSNVILMVGHVARRHAGNRLAKQLVESGAIGKPIMVEANLSSEQGLTLQPSDFRWRGDDLGCPGGPLMTMGIHHADTLMHIFGPVKRVYSMFNRLYVTAQIPDVTVTTLEFESGMLGYIGSNFSSPRSNWMTIYGTDANIVRTFRGIDRKLDPERKRSVDENTRLELIRGSGGAEEIKLIIGDPLLEQIDEFADCVMEGKQPETNGESSMRALAVIRAAIESATTGKPIDLIGPNFKNTYL